MLKQMMWALEAGRVYRELTKEWKEPGPLKDRIRYTLYLAGTATVLKARREDYTRIGRIFAFADIFDDLLDNGKWEKAKAFISAVKMEEEGLAKRFERLLRWKQVLKFKTPKAFMLWDLMETYGAFLEVVKKMDVSNALKQDLKLLTIHMNILDDIEDYKEDIKNGEPNFLELCIGKMEIKGNVGRFLRKQQPEKHKEINEYLKGLERRMKLKPVKLLAKAKRMKVLLV